MNDLPTSGSAGSPPSGSADLTVSKNPMGASGVDPRLLEILVCPVTKTTLRYDRERYELVSLAAHLAYPIRDGIPIMLPEEARRIEE
jgi:uncharacterized protein YbaR (Trm112 family)